VFQYKLINGLSKVSLNTYHFLRCKNQDFPPNIRIQSQLAATTPILANPEASALLLLKVSYVKCKFSYKKFLCSSLCANMVVLLSCTIAKYRKPWSTMLA